MTDLCIFLIDILSGSVFSGLQNPFTIILNSFQMRNIMPYFIFLFYFVLVLIFFPNYFY